MNIDVTATDGDRTWSEKFGRVASAVVQDGVLSITSYRTGRHVNEEPELVSMFSPGAWHSWRAID